MPDGRSVGARVPDVEPAVDDCAVERTADEEERVGAHEEERVGAHEEERVGAHEEERVRADAATPRRLGSIGRTDP